MRHSSLDIDRSVNPQAVTSRNKQWRTSGLNDNTLRIRRKNPSMADI